jgi:hypothetical protein
VLLPALVEVSDQNVQPLRLAPEPPQGAQRAEAPEPVEDDDEGAVPQGDGHPQRQGHEHEQPGERGDPDARGHAEVRQRDADAEREEDPLGGDLGVPVHGDGREGLRVSDLVRQELRLERLAAPVVK